MTVKLIGIVGPCSAGKSTLIAGLSGHGYTARHIAQEHSYVPDMWQRITNPDILIYLDVSYQESMRRRPSEMTQIEFQDQKQRLLHALRHADLYLDTEHLTIGEVRDRVLSFLENTGNDRKYCQSLNTLD